MILLKTAIYYYNKHYSLLLVVFGLLFFTPSLYAQETQGLHTASNETAPAQETQGLHTVSNETVILQEKTPETVKQPIAIDAETVEYSMDNKNVTASGRVVVDFKGTKLSCDKFTVNTDTKDGIAEGHVKLEDAQGVIEAEKMSYNFQTKAGVMTNALFRANPYFGKAFEIKKVNDIEFVGINTEMSTCSFDHPHYRFKTKKVDFFRGDKFQMKSTTITAGQDRQIPIMHLPFFNKSLKEPYMHVQFSPGHSKDWGYYTQTAWRYRLTDSIEGDILLDYRELMGIAEGFITNYKSQNFGKGDFKLYYTQERNKSKGIGTSVDIPKVFERYMGRLRHKWDIDPMTNLISEIYYIKDSKRMVLGNQYNFLKDFYPREYEKDEQPLSYLQVNHLFDNSNINLVVQKRINRWYNQLEKLPEIIYNLPSMPIGNSRLYFENASSFARYSYKNSSSPIPSANDVNGMTRVDLYNKMSYPLRAFVFQLNPFVANRSTYYNSDINANSLAPRTIFYSGADLSTKFYRIFNVKTGFLGLDINGLRHIITPTITYTFQNTPTIPSSKLKQIDGIDSINGVSNAAVFELDNKLQTKRNNTTVDLLDFRINSTYNFKSSSNRSGGSLSDFLLYLDFYPYSWLSLNTDATFSRSVRHFSQINTDLNFNFATDRTIGFGNRYTRGGSKEMTFQTHWRINPKWSARVYERYQFGNAVDLSSGIREQEYALIRDLHCWTMEVSYNLQKSKGETLWMVFRLKAFPELQFDYNQSYHQPQPGSQTK